MSRRSNNNTSGKKVEAFRHSQDKRPNIPTAEHQSVMAEEEKSPIRVAYERRNRDLDPQLVWRGKDEQDWSDLVVSAPPLYIQEKVHPKVIIDDLMRQSQNNQTAVQGELDLFADFNGLPDHARATEFYQHEANWTNRMILGDSLQVMASLAEREGLRGQVQMIYIDPPYGIKFNSNFQWSTTNRDVKDGKVEHITREPEQVKAFRDTWRDGIHSYLTYLRDRLTVARDLLTDSGSIFVQIGDENVHRVRCLMDEVFGDQNFVNVITYSSSVALGGNYLQGVCNYILFYAKNKNSLKFRKFYSEKIVGEGAYSSVMFPDGQWRNINKDELANPSLISSDAKPFFNMSLLSAGRTETCVFSVDIAGKTINPGAGRSWKTNPDGMKRIIRANRVIHTANNIRYVLFHEDYPVKELTDIWTDLGGATDKVYVVQTNIKVIQRCILMATDPGDLVLDPTCGSGTTAYVAEQWGRRWITIDTSRVALALARARIMGARYPYYLLADSPAGRQKEAEITGTTPPDTPTYGNIRLGFVYERVPHITLKSIANNTEIDVIYEKWQPQVLQALADLNAALRGHSVPYTVTTGGREGHQVKFNAPDDATFTMPSGEVVKAYELVEWEVPRQAPDDWSPTAKQHLETFWQARIARQKEIDASIAAKAEFEYLYDKPYEDKTIVRVAGPFTVESLSPHRVLAVDENDELIDPTPTEPQAADFTQIILETLRVAGVQQAHKEDKITFTSLIPWPGNVICAEGRYLEGETERRAGIFIGPEFGTVSRNDLVLAAREAGEAGFDVVIACAFNYDAHASEFTKLGRIPVLKARMNADLHMASALKNTDKANLFVIFGEPDICIHRLEHGLYQVEIRGVDIFHPQTGQVHSSEPDEIACWFIDTNYNNESFFVRHAYFVGASNDPYKALKTSLKAEIDEATWASLRSTISRPFPKPSSGRIAVKVINHLGDEVMKVFSIQ
ncbi:site-specific DNA-methyltransferase [Thermostichus sp. MS-CIW-41]|jgi:adenine-specific DNA-methyltransferase